MARYATGLIVMAVLVLSVGTARGQDAKEEIKQLDTQYKEAMKRMNGVKLRIRKSDDEELKEVTSQYRQAAKSFSEQVNAKLTTHPKGVELKTKLGELQKKFGELRKRGKKEGEAAATPEELDAVRKEMRATSKELGVIKKEIMADPAFDQVKQTRDQAAKRMNEVLEGKVLADTEGAQIQKELDEIKAKKKEIHEAAKAAKKAEQEATKKAKMEKKKKKEK